MVQNDLRWGEQVETMVNKASRNIWVLRRMKKLGLDEKTICNFWKAARGSICGLGKWADRPAISQTPKNRT